ncbi:hypothetical protein HMPREF6745_0205 [Prevotella sp. oral taxon 472 str. F0295]|nr:ImmA/IrrE family metallo-endopeptidase [Prevotella sp. oral taxon 472]EEX54273.1 hypothetical protein HMPREF6745_0205 [Prevotella sp. oral taxon 472 str. F0295]
MSKVSINKERIKYLLALYRMSEEELLREVSKKLRKVLTWEDIYHDSVPLYVLKRIDRVFNKGLFYYADPITPKQEKHASVFFRKATFGTNLNFGARLRVREFEDLKTRLNTISKLSDIKLERRLPVVSIATEPREFAFEMRKMVLPLFTNDKRTFLKNFINKLGEQNIFVFEFVDVDSKKNKANVDGFYIHPNAIVLRRMQKSFSREIFTLAHELGHYLLDREEIEQVDVATMSRPDVLVSEEERWCNTFAYFLLLGEDMAKELDNIPLFDWRNDYGHDLVKQISKETTLSRLAIFTNLLVQKKLSYRHYIDIKSEMEEQWRQKEYEREIKKAEDKAKGIETQGRNPRPIRADIVADIFTLALSSGVIGEQEFCKGMDIKPKEINKFVY